MKIVVFMGSPKLDGNTSELCKPFIDQLLECQNEVKYITLANKQISSCKGCYSCQYIEQAYGCVQKDDMYGVVDDIIWADCIVLATPVYTWYCTTEMKALLDRLFGLNKQYRTAQGSFLSGKDVAILATHGYPASYGVDLFEEGIKRLCQHSNLNYKGMYSVCDVDDLASFQTNQAISGAREFAKTLSTTKK